MWIGSAELIGKYISQGGTFDRFLGSEHEAMIHDYEEISIDFIRAFRLAEYEKSQGMLYRGEVDTDALVRFVSSVLWRFHMSKRLEAQTVNVGGWEPALRAVTFDGDLGRAPDVLVAALATRRLPSDKFAYMPTQGRFDERRVWTVVLNGLCFMVKLDKQPWSPSSRSVVINGRSLVSGPVKFISPEEVGSMVGVFERMLMGGKLRSPSGPR